MSRSLALLVALGLACGIDPPPPLVADEPIAERDATGTLVVRWSAAPPGPVPVYAGPSHERIDRSRPVASLLEGRAEIDTLPFEGRPYLELAPPGQPTALRVAERRLPLEGMDNFRDLGGYRTADGRRVRWGRIYRSGQLGDLTDADLAYLDGLGLRLVCDLRSPLEREAAPDRLPAGVRVLEIGIYAEGLDPAELQEKILRGDVGDTDLGAMLVEGNRAFVSAFADRYATLLDALLAPDALPAVVHCTAGKDRAGMAAALILLALGVPEATVVQDFMRTNHYTHQRIERTLRTIRWVSLLRTDPADVRPVLGVEERYLRAGLDAMREHHGSVEAFLREGLGLTPERRARLRALLLETERPD